MVEQVDNNDIVDAGNTIADILTLINDNVVEQNERISSNASMISGICRQMDELKEARPNLTVVIREAIHEAVVEELDGRDILSKDELLHWHRSDDFIDGVVEVINDYDMDEKFNDALRYSDVIDSNNFGDELNSHDVAYKDDIEDLHSVEGLADTVDAMLFDRKLKEAEASDPDLYDIHMKNIGRQAVVAFKAEQAKLKEEKESADKLATLPPLPQPSN